MASQERAKMFIVDAKYSHQTEVDTRLSFLKEFASSSGFQISKAELKVIYDLLKESPIKSDLQEFYSWCKKTSKTQTITN